MQLFIVAFGAFCAASAIIISVENALLRLPQKSGDLKAQEEKRDRAGERAETKSEWQVILKRNLFRARLNAELPRQKTDKEIEEETLANAMKEMTLKGIVLGKNMESYAIIELGRDKGVFAYSIGDVVQKGLRLHHIGENEIELKKDEFTFSLRLFAKGFQKKEAPSLAGSWELKRPEGAVRTRGEVVKREGNRIIIQRGFVETAKNDAALRSSILASVAVKASLDAKGNPNGFKIVSVDKGSLVEKAGIMAGDVIQEVNGFRIASNEDVNKAYEALKDARSFEVKILRDGRPMMLRYEIR